MKMPEPPMPLMTIIVASNSLRLRAKVGRAAGTVMERAGGARRSGARPSGRRAFRWLRRGEAVAGAVGAAGFPEGQGDRGRARFAVLLDVDEDFLVGQAEDAADRLEDAQVGLVGDEQGSVCGGQSPLAQHLGAGG